MKNVTLAIDEGLLKRARGLAEGRKTTLNALVRSLLAQAVEQDERIAVAKDGLRRLMDESTGERGAGFHWNRQEIYEDRENRMLSRHEHPDLRGDGKKA